MFKNLKTSTQISLRFTFFSAGILFVVACVINFFFFSFWYFDLRSFRIEPFDIFANQFQNDESGKIEDGMVNKNEILGEKDVRVKITVEEKNGERGEQCDNGRCIPLPRQRFNPEQNFPQHRLHLKLDSEEAKDILNKTDKFNISVIDGYYIYVEREGDSLQVFNITSQVQLQYTLLWISVLMLIIGTGLSYVVSLFFVKSALKKLNTLIEVLDDLDIDNLNKKITIEGSEDDEINKVINKFNQSFEKIHSQALGLKDFVRNASHELRTPLMGMSTLIDLARKSKDYEGTLNKVKGEIKRMDSLLETLLLITKVEEKVELKKEKINIVPGLKLVIKQLRDEFEGKNIDVEETIPESLELLVHQQGWESIMTNVLRNAFKYTEEHGKIEISLSKSCFKVWNSGEGIESKNFEKIWERFWQGDSSHTDSKSFGLGLYLSKLFATKQGFDLRCESEKGNGVSFILDFN